VQFENDMSFHQDREFHHDREFLNIDLKGHVIFKLHIFFPRLLRHHKNQMLLHHPLPLVATGDLFLSWTLMAPDWPPFLGAK
jgi:hypothetical protein